MAYTHQYIGSRYVPLFAEPAEWDSTRTYEPLTIVLNEGNSYTSRQFVPVGVELTNTDYWLETGNYNAQVEQYRQEVLDYVNNFNDFKSTFENIFIEETYTETVRPIANSIYIHCTFSNGVICTNDNVAFFNCSVSAKHECISGNNVNNIYVYNCTFSLTEKSLPNTLGNYHIIIWNGQAGEVNESFVANRHSNIIIKNCKFNYEPNYLTRSIRIYNTRNVHITNCIIHSNSSYVKDGTGDIIAIDMCENCAISDITIDWSGENGIDILSCKNVVVNNCSIGTCDYACISIDASDVMVTRGSTVDATNYNIEVHNITGIGRHGILQKNTVNCYIHDCIFTGTSDTQVCVQLDVMRASTGYTIISNTSKNIRIKRIVYNNYSNICSSKINKLFSDWGQLELDESNPFIFTLPSVPQDTFMIIENDVDFQLPLTHFKVFGIASDGSETEIRPLSVKLFLNDTISRMYSAGYELSFQPFTSAFNHAIRFGTYATVRDFSMAWSPSSSVKCSDMTIRIEAW